MRQFKRQHPHIQFDVYLTESTMDLIDAQVDLALRSSEAVDEYKIQHPLYHQVTVDCAQADYPNQPRPLILPQ
ncbi:hypothetical protein, partial [Enterococcus faecium]|uniref:hypothetical protein n=1 Tax=Enterococcus faecium TaxID=1352 RepID=UPI0034DB2555